MIDLVMELLWDWLVFVTGVLVGCFWVSRQRNTEPEIAAPPSRARLRVVHTNDNEARR